VPTTRPRTVHPLLTEHLPTRAIAITLIPHPLCLGPTSLTQHAPTSRESSRFLHPAQWLLYSAVPHFCFLRCRVLFCRYSNTTPTLAALPSSFIRINEEEDVGGSGQDSVSVYDPPVIYDQ
jgi:hypothetical protein